MAEVVTEMGRRWLPIEDAAFWAEFQRTAPFHALSMWQRAQMALGIDPNETQAP